MAMNISANDRLITDILHFAANRSEWQLSIRRSGGAFSTVAKGSYSSKLRLDQDYQFEVEASDAAVTVRVPGREIRTEISTLGVLGDKAYWQEYPTTWPKNVDTGVVFEFDAVWAIEEGQAAAPVSFPPTRP